MTSTRAATTVHAPARGAILVICGALLAGAAVATGAYGAHGLRARLEADATREPSTDPALAVERLTADFDVAVRYHTMHALALILVGILARLGGSRWWTVAATLFLLGLVLFSGSLYSLVFTRAKWWGAVVPFGGMAFLFAWLAVAAGALATRRNSV